MTYSDQVYPENQGALLFILTGDSRHMPATVRPERKRGVKRVTFVTGKLPAEPVPDKRNRNNPANPNMNESRAWAREQLHKCRSHSDRIQDTANEFGRFRVMSNMQKIHPSRGQSPCHRDILPGELPNIKPAKPVTLGRIITRR